MKLGDRVVNSPSFLYAAISFLYTVTHKISLNSIRTLVIIFKATPEEKRFFYNYCRYNNLALGLTYIIFHLIATGNVKFTGIQTVSDPFQTSFSSTVT